MLRTKFTNIFVGTAMTAALSGCSPQLFSTISSHHGEHKHQKIDNYDQNGGVEDTISEPTLEELRQACIEYNTHIQEVRDVLINDNSNVGPISQKEFLQLHRKRNRLYEQFFSQEDELVALLSDSLETRVTKTRAVMDASSLKKWYETQTLGDTVTTWLEEAKKIDDEGKQTRYILEKLGHCRYISDKVSFGKFLEEDNCPDGFFDIEYFVHNGGDCEDFAVAAYCLLHLGLGLPCHYIKFQGHADIAIPAEWISNEVVMNHYYGYMHQKKPFVLIEIQGKLPYRSMHYSSFEVLGENINSSAFYDKRDIIEFSLFPESIKTVLRDSFAVDGISYEELQERSPTKRASCLYNDKLLSSYAYSLGITQDVTTNKKAWREFLALLYPEKKKEE